ncbi:MAG: hypothetical protein U0R19_07270 [Bryobacteraceae bacterium]
MDFFSFFLPMLILFGGSEKERKEAERKARERRMAEHRMNARLLRLNI